jgi:inorganic phosphate transporter, PiT family
VEDVLLVVVVAIALGFDFTNGFHDTANAVATSVGTRALTPRVAVLIAAVAISPGRSSRLPSRRTSRLD